MKPGTLITRIVVLVLFVAVVFYIGATVWQGMTDPYRMVATYAYTMDDGAALEGFVARQEQVIDGDPYLAEILPDEGEKVAAGAAVAAVYQSQEALAQHKQAQALELQLDQLQYAMRRNDNAGDATALDSQLVDALATLHTAASSNSLSELEDIGLDLRSLVVKRTGDLTTSAESLAALQAAASEVEAQLDQLNAASAQNTRYITVTQSGVFSGMADGYEGILTPDILDTITAAQVEALKTQAVTPPTAVGKLITSTQWYFVTTVDDATAQRLEQGQRYTIDFTGDFDQELSMTLERLGALEQSEHVAVFSSKQYLSQATLARLQSATLVFQRFTGVRVPDLALRVLDNDDGTTTLGVFTLVGRQAEFKPVEIVRQGDGFYLVKSTATNRKILRAGDLIILSNQELYDGKVVA